MRRAWLVILAILLLAPGGRTQSVQLALDGAADLSPVYPTTKIPAKCTQSPFGEPCSDRIHRAWRFGPAGDVREPNERTAANVESSGCIPLNA